jgi:integrase
MKIKGIYNMPGSKFYWYRWTARDGKRKAVSLKTANLAEAIAAVEKIQAGEWLRTTKMEAPDTPGTKLVEAYIAKAQVRNKKPMRKRTAHRRKSTLLKFVREARINNVQDITLPAIEAWLAKHRAAGNAQDTIFSYAWIVKIFVRDLIGQGLLKADDFAKWEMPDRGTNGRANWLRLDEVKKIITRAKDDPDLQFILYAGLGAGLRRSEILATKAGWFDLENGTLQLQNDPPTFLLKDGDNRPVPLTDQFKEFLTSYLQGKSSNDYALKPEVKTWEGEYRYNFMTLFSNHMKKCGVKCTAHDMRRSFASNLVSKGVSIYKVAKWLGDGVAIVEKHYGHLAPADRDVNVLSMA